MFCRDGERLRQLALADGRDANTIDEMSETEVMLNVFDSVVRQATLKEIGKRWTEKRRKGEI